MPDRVKTSFTLEQESLDKLRELSGMDRRAMSRQLEFLIDREYEQRKTQLERDEWEAGQ